ncbi:hypothetical protein LCGC14_1700980 [marine sediment metagenome]|uniref:Fibronectin type-III domain-containing protein n=1 Tax=marine sediment metagenome TaxID=412755 RepID=A0A0F9I5L3_9ZZZZ
MPFEDFIPWEPEVDPNGRIAPTTRRVTWTSLTRNEDAYYYDDKGAAFFSADFVHFLTINITTAAASCEGGTWALTNDLDDLRGLKTNNKDALFLYFIHTGGNLKLQINELDGGTSYAGTAYNATAGTVYYVSIERDESVGTYGTLYLYLFSDEARTTLVNSQSIALHTSKKDFQYVHVVQTWNAGTSHASSGYSENLDLSAPILPIVTAQPLTDIASTTATGHGTIVDLGISAVTAHGYCWATTINPTTADSKTDEGAGSLGVFTSSITGLSAGQEYYFRPYATNGAGTGYGANVYFIAGQPGTLRIKGEYAVVQTRWHYVDENGVEYKIQGEAV